MGCVGAKGKKIYRKNDNSFTYIFLIPTATRLYADNYA